MSERTERIHELIAAAQAREGRQDVGVVARLDEYQSENDAALAALGRLFDQVIHTAGDDAGRTRAIEDMWTIHDALTRIIPPGKEKSHE